MPLPSPERVVDGIAIHPLSASGGVITARKRFGTELNRMLDALNEALAA